MIKRPGTTTSAQITKTSLLEAVKTASKEKLNVMLSTLYMLNVEGKEEVEAAIKSKLSGF